MNDRNNPFKINKLCLMLSHGNERVEAGFCINLFIYNACYACKGSLTNIDMKDSSAVNQSIEKPLKIFV